MAANHHLRQVLYAVNLAAMAYPEAYLGSRPWGGALGAANPQPSSHLTGPES